MAGLGLSISKMMGVEPHPYPTHTCRKYCITRQRNQYEIKRLSQCIKENCGEPKEVKDE
jgi:hypothetical protein